MNTKNDARSGAVAGPVERPVRPLAEKCRDMAAQAGHYGAWSGGVLLEQAADELERLTAVVKQANDQAENYSADSERFRWLAEHTVATGLARWVHPFQFLAEAVDARRKAEAASAAPRVTTAAELRQQAKSDTSCVGAFARARPGKA